MRYTRRYETFDHLKDELNFLEGFGDPTLTETVNRVRMAAIRSLNWFQSATSYQRDWDIPGYSYPSVTRIQMAETSLAVMSAAAQLQRIVEAQAGRFPA